MGDIMRLPLGGMFTLLLVFSVLIGPVNMIVLARLKRRIWMLWTVPVFSFSACCVILAYSVMSEGITPKVYDKTITVLDQRLHEATTIGTRVYYAPIKPAAGFHFARTAEIRPVLGSRRHSSYRRHNRESVNHPVIDWTVDQHLVSGWVLPRVPAAFQIRKSEKRRERLDFSRTEDGTLEVVNGLGEPISFLIYADVNGKIYCVSNIAAGARAKLELAPGRQIKQTPANLREIYLQSPWPQAIDRVIEKPDKYLSRNTYCAVLETSPFLAPGIAKAKAIDTRTAVYGITKGVR